MRKLKLAVLSALLAAGIACTGGRSGDQCLEDLVERHDRAAGHAATRADAIADTIEGALDIHKESGLDSGQIRLLRRAQQQARDLQAYLDSTFGAGCQ